MKIKREDFEALRSAVEKILDVFPNLQDDYARAGLSQERFAWDLLWDSKFDVSKFYNYLNDSHIQTALFRIIKDHQRKERKC